MSQQNQNRPKVDWQVMAVLEDGNIGVEVKKLPLTKPRYSLTLVSKRKDNTWAPRVNVDTYASNARVTVASQSMQIAKLISEGEQLIEADAQAAEDAFWESKRKNEERKLNRGRDQGGSADMQRKRIKDEQRQKRERQ